MPYLLTKNSVEVIMSFVILLACGPRGRQRNQSSLGLQKHKYLAFGITLETSNLAEKFET